MPESPFHHRMLSRRDILKLGLAGGSLAALSAIGVACGGDDDDDGQSAASGGPTGTGVLASIITSELVTGPNRFAFALFDSKNQPVLKTPAMAQFYNLADQSNPKLVGEVEAKYYEIEADDGDEHAQGEAQHANLYAIYVVNQRFDTAGAWGLQVQTADGRKTETGVGFNVVAKPATPGLGAVAPKTASPTSVDRKDASELCTRKPSCGLHTMTIAEAMTQGKPAIISFSTPAYCTSRVCGPMLEIVLDSYSRHRAEANYVHVEIYQSGQNRQRLSAVTEWNLPSEPWLFITDGKGNLAAKFEGVMAPEELESALQLALKA